MGRQKVCREGQYVRRDWLSNLELFRWCGTWGSIVQRRKYWRVYPRRQRVRISFLVRLKNIIWTGVQYGWDTSHRSIRCSFNWVPISSTSGKNSGYIGGGVLYASAHCEDWSQMQSFGDHKATSKCRDGGICDGPDMVEGENNIWWQCWVLNLS